MGKSNISKEQLEHLINKQLSTRKIAKELKCSPMTVKNRLKEYNLKQYFKEIIKLNVIVLFVIIY